MGSSAPHTAPALKHMYHEQYYRFKLGNGSEEKNKRKIAIQNRPTKKKKKKKKTENRQMGGEKHFLEWVEMYKPKRQSQNIIYYYVKPVVLEHTQQGFSYCVFLYSPARQ